MAVDFLRNTVAAAQFVAQILAQVFGFVVPPQTDHFLQLDTHHLGVLRHGRGGRRTRGGGEFAGGVRQQQHAAIGLTEQTAPGRVFIDQLVHVARGFIGQQIHIQAVQLGFVDDGRQAVVVAGNQQMFTGMVFSQAGDVG